MRLQQLLVAVQFLFASASLLAAGEPDIRRDPAVVAVERVMPSVVNIATETLIEVHNAYDELFREFYGGHWIPRQQRSVSLGSGVIIDEEGDLLTNYHVVERATRIQVKLWDGREYEAEPRGGTLGRDVALLRIKARTGDKFTAVKFATADDLLLGETVLALGNPFGLGGSVTKGILSSKTRRPNSGNEPLDINDWLQTDAAINPGNSGGPLINLHGELIGLNVAVFRQGQGIGFAIPVKQLSAALEGLFSPEVTERLWFGARFNTSPGPLIVTSVQQGSPAFDAGLREGDRVLQLNGQTPSSLLDFNSRVARLSGNKAELLIEHDNARKSVTVSMIPFDKLSRVRLGLSLEQLKPEEARRLGIQPGTALIVGEVQKDGPADKAEIKHGYLVTELDNQPAGDSTAVGSILASKAKGDSVRLKIVAPLRLAANFIEFRQTFVDVPVR